MHTHRLAYSILTSLPIISAASSVDSNRRIFSLLLACSIANPLVLKICAIAWSGSFYRTPIHQVPRHQVYIIRSRTSRFSARIVCRSLTTLSRTGQYATLSWSEAMFLIMSSKSTMFPKTMNSILASSSVSFSVYKRKHRDV